MNYFYYEYAKSQICTIQENTSNHYSALSTYSYLNTKCLQNGSTLEGRKKAFTYQMKIKKYVPIVVNIQRKEIYFPSRPIKDASCIWINYGNIKKVDYSTTSCTIHFYDNTTLNCENPQRIRHSMHMIFRYLEFLKRN